VTIKAIITDIEGTTTSLSFVKDILFPYARANMADYVRRHEDDPQVKQLLADVRRESGLNPRPGSNRGGETGQLIDQLIRWMDGDKKITPLKSLQGLIWKEGYERGAFHGHLYPDAAENLKDWRACGLELYVYSSGSVQAQKLLFAHTDYGDLTPLFSGYFDTHTGGKKEQESYRKIAEEIGYPGDRLLFLSDIKEELDAARASGLQTIWLTREGSSGPRAEHLQVKSFDEISINL
jgi:enolase-phosphatase E1